MACAHLEQALDAYDPHQQRALILQYGEDMGTVCLHYARVTLQVLGYPDQALAKNREALALAESLSHPFILAREFGWSAYFHQLRREARTAQARAEAALALIDEHGFAPIWRAQGALARGWAIAQQGQAEAGIAEIRPSLDVFQTFGYHICQPYNFGMLAEAYKRDR